MMKILELGLKAILSEQREFLLDSLLAGGIDVMNQKWDHTAVMHNAELSVGILLVYAQREGPQFLRIIRDGLQRGEYLSTMAYIYIMAECSHRLPPYWSIQHAVDEKLLEEYCICLKEIVYTYTDASSADRKS